MTVTVINFQLKNVRDILYMKSDFSKASIEKHLKNRSGVELHVYDCVDSTNRLAMELAADGAADGTVIAAAAQTAGRGRLGRSFFSPDGSGVYISVILRPDALLLDAQHITAAAAVAVCHAIAGITEEAPYIKWVNDIYMRDHKVCGILVQSVSDKDRMGYAVVGIGVNLVAPEEGFPPEVAAVAGSVLDRSTEDIRARFVASVIENVMECCAIPIKQSVIDEYRRRSWLDGHNINVIRGGNVTPARAIEIDDDCRLRVCYSDGSEERLVGGEVSIRRT